MPRGMDERFEDPSDEGDEESDSVEEETTTETENRSDQQKTTSTTDTGSPTNDGKETNDEPLNIREDWDSATIYVEPEQSEDIEITFTRLKKQLKREGITLEKNKHFYRGIFQVAFDEYREETKEKIHELAKQDVDE